MSEEKIIRIFGRRTQMTPTDELAFFGEPPLFELPDLPVRVSVTFTWDVRRAFRLYDAWRGRFSDVQIGGPALPGTRLNPLFVAGRFLREGITMTSRGCPNHCPWCVVPRNEGPLSESIHIEPGHCIQDNNLLACSRPHVERVFNMLMQQSQAAVFAGGLDARLLDSWHIDRFKKTGFRLKEAWFSCDTPSSLARLDRVRDLMSDFRLRQKRCYVLMGFDPDDSPEKADARCEAVLEKSFCPFAMLYQPTCWRDYSREWKAVQRKWSRPAAYLSNSRASECGK